MFLSRVMLVLVFVASWCAFGFETGGTLYVVQAAQLRKEPKAAGKVISALARHEKVQWMAAVPKNAGWQQVVTASGKIGFVETTALTSEKPREDAPRDAGFNGTKPDGGLDADEAALLEAEQMNR